MNGTETLWPDTADKATAMVAVPALSATLWPEEENPTAGVASSSTMVAVCTMDPPSVALVGVPRVMITVSSGSSKASSSAVMVMAADSAPAGIVSGLVDMV